MFYAADVPRTACGELGYWRWRHLLDVPSLHSMPVRPQTVFRTKLVTTAVGLREPPFQRDRQAWPQPDDYRACQRFGAVARDACIGVVRYESVRDPKHGGCCAVLVPHAFTRPSPVEQQTWMLSVSRDRIVWQRTHTVAGEEHEFAAELWKAPT